MTLKGDEYIPDASDRKNDGGNDWEMKRLEKIHDECPGVETHSFRSPFSPVAFVKISAFSFLRFTLMSARWIVSSNYVCFRYYNFWSHIRVHSVLEWKLIHNQNSEIHSPKSNPNQYLGVYSSIFGWNSTRNREWFYNPLHWERQEIMKRVDNEESISRGMKKWWDW